MKNKYTAYYESTKPWKDQKTKLTVFADSLEDAKKKAPNTINVGKFKLVEVK